MHNKRSHKNGRRSKRGGEFTSFMNDLFSSKPSTDEPPAATPVAPVAAPVAAPAAAPAQKKTIADHISSLLSFSWLSPPKIDATAKQSNPMQPPPMQPPPATNAMQPNAMQPNAMQQPSAANTMPPTQDLEQGQGQGDTKPFIGGSKRKSKTHKKHKHKPHKKHNPHNKRSRK